LGGGSRIYIRKPAGFSRTTDIERFWTSDLQPQKRNVRREQHFLVENGRVLQAYSASLREAIFPVRMCQKRITKFLSNRVIPKTLICLGLRGPTAHQKRHPQKDSKGDPCPSINVSASFRRIRAVSQSNQKPCLPSPLSSPFLNLLPINWRLLSNSLCASSSCRD